MKRSTWRWSYIYSIWNFMVCIKILVGDLQMVLKSLLYGKFGHWSWRHMDHDHHLWNQWPLLPLKSSQTWNCIVQCVQRSVLKEAWYVKSTNWETAEGVAGKVAARFCPFYSINYMLDLMCFFLAKHALHTKKSTTMSTRKCRCSQI